MKVYLVRHTSVDVAPGTCYGQTDVPLRASFQEEAEACKKALQDTGMRFSRIYTSPFYMPLPLPGMKHAGVRRSARSTSRVPHPPKYVELNILSFSFI
jgi:hypothetical protein